MDIGSLENVATRPQPLRVSTVVALVIATVGAALSLTPGMQFVGLPLAMLSLMLATLRRQVLLHSADRWVLLLAGTAVVVSVLWLVFVMPANLFPETTTISAAG